MVIELSSVGWIIAGGAMLVIIGIVIALRLTPRHHQNVHVYNYGAGGGAVTAEPRNSDRPRLRVPAWLVIGAAAAIGVLMFVSQLQSQSAQVQTSQAISDAVSETSKVYQSQVQSLNSKLAEQGAQIEALRATVAAPVPAPLKVAPTAPPITTHPMVIDSPVSSSEGTGANSLVYVILLVTIALFLTMAVTTLVVYRKYPKPVHLNRNQPEPLGSTDVQTGAISRGNTLASRVVSGALNTAEPLGPTGSDEQVWESALDGIKFDL